MSSSTAATDNPPAQEPPLQTQTTLSDKKLVQDMKKKLKVLKAALKEERTQKANVEKELQTAIDRVEQFKLQLQEKVILI